MVLELTIIPRGSGISTSSAIAGLVQIIEASGLDYQMTALRIPGDVNKAFR